MIIHLYGISVRPFLVVCNLREHRRISSELQRTNRRDPPRGKRDTAAASQPSVRSANARCPQNKSSPGETCANAVCPASQRRTKELTHRFTVCLLINNKSPEGLHPGSSSTLTDSKRTRQGGASPSSCSQIQRQLVRQVHTHSTTAIRVCLQEGDSPPIHTVPQQPPSSERQSEYQN